MQLQRIALVKEKARLTNEKYKPRIVGTFLNYTTLRRQNNEIFFSFFPLSLFLADEHIANGKAREKADGLEAEGIYRMVNI